MGNAKCGRAHRGSRSPNGGDTVGIDLLLRANTEGVGPVRIWIVDVDGALLYIDGETHLNADRELGLEIEQTIESTQFAQRTARASPYARVLTTSIGSVVRTTCHRHVRTLRQRFCRRGDWIRFAGHTRGQGVLP
jgi:hypothetical protein